MIVTQTNIDDALLVLDSASLAIAQEMADEYAKGCNPCNDLWLQQTVIDGYRHVLDNGLYYVSSECITTTQLWDIVQKANALAVC